MQVSVESAGGLQRKLTVTVPQDQIDQAVEERLKNMTHSVKLKGFRAGKVPLRVVQQRYGKQVRQEVLGELMQSSFYEAISKEKLRPAGTPAFDSQSTGTEQGFEYTATFEVYPEIQLKSMSGISLDIPSAEITEADVDEMLETIRKQHVTWEEAGRAAKEGDQLTIDYQGSIDGESFSGGDGKDVQLELGQGRMIAGFEEGLLGASAGDSVTLDLQFPDTYHAKELAGKAVQFAVQVNRVEAPVLPEINVEFATKLGIEDGDLDKMRVEVRSNMQRELDTTLKRQVKQTVMDKLYESNTLELPAALIQSESQNLMQQMQQNLMRQGMAEADLKMEPSMFAGEAERRVSLGLIMSEIVKAEGFTAEPGKVREMVETIAQPYEHPEEVVKWYYADKQRLGEIESLVLEEQVVEWVLKEADVKEKPQNFKELMHPSSGQNQ